MPGPITQLNAAAATWSHVVTSVVWQSTLLALVVGVLAWGLRRASPSLRYWLWQIVAIKILVAPLWALPVALPAWWQPPLEAPGNRRAATLAPDEDRLALASEPIQEPLEAVDEDEQITARARHASPPWHRRLTVAGWLFAAWLAVVVAEVLVLIVQRVGLARFMRGTQPAEAEITGQVARIAAQLGLRRPPRVAIAEGACSPFVFGLWRPVLVLPARVLASMPLSRLAPVLVHELAHLARGDLWWGWIPAIACRLYFFHPVAWWVNYRVRLERELACDQRALALTGQGAAAYAEMLVDVVSQGQAPAVPFATAIKAELMGNHLNAS